MGSLSFHFTSLILTVRIDCRASIRREAASMTASKLPALLQRRHALRRRILKFRQLQAAHMPSALAVLSEDAKARTDVEEVENVRLGLPSDFSRTR